MGSATDAQRDQAIKASLLYTKYSNYFDRDSAYEFLMRQQQVEAKEAEEAKAAAEQAKIAEKEAKEAALAKEKAEKEAAARSLKDNSRLSKFPCTALSSVDVVPLRLPPPPCTGKFILRDKVILFYASSVIKSCKDKAAQNRGRLLFHGFIRLWLRNSRLRLSNSLATTTNFISWNYATVPDVLLMP